MTEYLIVGAGFAGSVCARRLADAGHRVRLVDQRNHIGGNAYDSYNDDGVLVHKYGAHIFHTNAKTVVEYLSQFTEWRPYEHRVLASVEGTLLPVPINRTTLAHFGGDIERAIDALYRPYTRKQWGMEIEDLDPSVLARVKVRDSDDDRYFTDRYQMMPLHGYTRLFERMLDHPNIQIHMQTTCADVLGRGWSGPIIYTGPLDQWFACVLGTLPYRSARFEWRRETTAQAAAVVNVPSPTLPYTRICDCRQLTGQRHEYTSLCMEYPSATGEPYWPIPTSANLALAKRYRAMAAALAPRVQFLGRLGSYQYYDMHHVIAQALTLTQRLLERTAA